MPTMHKDLKGISRPEAESMYIKEATDPNGCPHNMHLYKLYKTSNNSTLSKKFNHYSIESKIWFGVCHNGVSIYGESKQSLKTQISFFAWMDIGKLFFDKKKFEIRSVGFPIRKFTYFTSSEEISKNILWLCKITHRFQLMISPKLNEIKKREQELTRRKYRESYIYSGDESQLNCDLSYNFLTRDRVSKMSQRQEETAENCNKVGTSDDNKNETSERKGSSYSSCEKESLCSEQRVSVISNTSSNTTSGIMSDKVQSLEGDSEADDIVVDSYDIIDGTQSPFPPIIPHTHMSSIQAVHYSLESLAISDHSSGISGDMVRSSSSAAEAVEHGSSSLSSVSPVLTSLVSTNESSFNSNLLSKTDCKWYSNQESKSNIDDSKISNSGANSTRSTSSEQSVNTIKSTIPFSSLSSTLTGSTQLNNAFPSPSSLKSLSNQDVQSVTNSPIIAIRHETQSQRQLIEGQSCAKLETDEKERPPIRSESMYHIYENIPFHRSLNQRPPPPPPLSSIPSPLLLTPRSATKIGVSSLNRFANQGSPTASTSALSNSHQFKLNNFYPQQNVAGSEPDLYNSKLWSPKGPVTCLPSDFQSLPGINSSYSCSIPDYPSCKATRALSDPTVLSPFIKTSSSSCSTTTTTTTATTTSTTSTTTTSTTTTTTTTTTATSHPLFAYSSTISTTLSNSSSQPTFHQSLNNISSSIELLRLVESDINVSDYPSIPPPQGYATKNFIKNTSHLNGTKTSNMADDKPKSNSEEHLIINGNQSRTENGQFLNFQQIKQKSQNIDLPLITALFNDRSLMLPKTVPTCSRQRYVANIRVKDDDRRYSNEEPFETPANAGSLSASFVDDQLNSDKVTSIPISEGENKTVIEIVSNKSLSGNNRPISWHQDNRYNLPLNDNCIQKKSNPRAEFIEKLWSEHFLD